MNDYLFLIFGYLLIFFSIIFFYFRLKKLPLTKEDHYFWLKFKRGLHFLKERFLKIVKISRGEIVFLLRSFLEKVLLRIKIEALKVETWANQKLEKLKQNSEETKT